MGRKFLSTPSARRATAPNSTPSTLRTVFLSTPSARRATKPGLWYTRFAKISIHALREEGDTCVWLAGFPAKSFLSTPSARRATVCRADSGCSAQHFYPRPPRGGRPGLCGISIPWQNFYPRPPRGGRPMLCHSAAPMITFLSTPSARRATRRSTTNTATGKFLSTPSARRATFYDREGQTPEKDFYPRPPRGGRRVSIKTHS